MTSIPLRQPPSGTASSEWATVEALEFQLSTLVEAFCARGDRSVVVEWSEHLGRSVASRPDLPRPGAGLMKLCLVGAIIDLVEREQLNFDQPVPVSRFGRSRQPSLSRVFDRQRSFSLRELCRLALATGDNPMATALADLCTVDDICEAMLYWGLPPESFSYVAGYSDEELGHLSLNNRISASSLMAILRRFTEYRDLRDFGDALANAPASGRILAGLPYGAKVAQISGDARGVANDAGMIEVAGTRIWLVVLTESEPDICAVHADIAELAAALTAAITRHQS